MVEGALRRLPANQRKVLAVVLRMTTDAGLVGLFNAHHACMEPALPGHAMVDLFVTLGAPEDGRSGKEAMA